MPPHTKHHRVISHHTTHTDGHPVHHVKIESVKKDDIHIDTDSLKGAARQLKEKVGEAVTNLLKWQEAYRKQHDERATKENLAQYRRAMPAQADSITDAEAIRRSLSTDDIRNYFTPGSGGFMSAGSSAMFAQGTKKETVSAADMFPFVQRNPLGERTDVDDVRVKEPVVVPQTYEDILKPAPDWQLVNPAKLHPTPNPLISPAKPESFTDVPVDINIPPVTPVYDDLPPLKRLDPANKQKSIMVYVPQRTYIGLPDRGNMTPEEIAYHDQINIEESYNRGYDEKANKLFWRRLADDKHFQGFANNIVTPMIDMYGIEKIPVDIGKLVFEGAEEKSISSLSQIESRFVPNTEENIISSGVRETPIVGKLRGEDVELPGFRNEKITFTKQTSEEVAKLRTQFNNTERPKFLKWLADDPEKAKQLKEAGLTDEDIVGMKKGKLPRGYSVHHRVPLKGGGNNSFDNLQLIKEEPYHKVITNTQRSATKDMKVGDVKTIDFPINNDVIYPKN